MDTAAVQDARLHEWTANEQRAEAMIPMIGRLYRENEVIVTMFGRSAVHCSSIELIKLHRISRQYLDPAATGAGLTELSVQDTWPVLQQIASLPLTPCRVDLGKMTRLAQAAGREEAVWRAAVAQELAPATLQGGKPTPGSPTAAVSAGSQQQQQQQQHLLDRPRDVVLYGFGRIGRLLARILIEKTGGGGKLRLRAVVVRPGKSGNCRKELEKRANLLRRDSVHGQFNGSISVCHERSSIIANGVEFLLLYASDPGSMDYAAHGIQDAILIDNTGVWRDRAGLTQHLQARGVDRVLVTAPGKGDVRDIVVGVNDDTIDKDEHIYGAASCTTNAVAPALKLLHERYGIRSGHVETIHSYTNDQNLTDNYHAKERRGRAAALNMVITETGAANAVAKAIPALAGRFTGNAIRVPTPDVSLAILMLRMERSVGDKDAVNTFLRSCALGSASNQLDYTTSEEVTSSDLVGRRAAGVLDASSTIVAEQGSSVNLYLWYDNEFGYSCQVVRLVQRLAGVVYPRYPCVQATSVLGV